MARPRALGWAYVYPAMLAGVAVVSAIVGFGPALGLFQPTSRFTVVLLDAQPFFGVEILTLLLGALLSTLAVRRAIRGKDLWTMRAYWPVLLLVYAVIALGAFAVYFPDRSCGVGYLGWGCWDPDVSLLRTALAAALTAGFTFLVARYATDRPETGERARRDDRPPGEGVEEKTEEIPAR